MYPDIESHRSFLTKQSKNEWALKFIQERVQAYLNSPCRNEKILDLYEHMLDRTHRAWLESLYA